MALLRAAGLCRLALRAPWAAVRLLSSTSGGERLAGEDKPAGRRVDLEALRRERALRPPVDRAPPALPRKVHRSGYATPEQLQVNKELQECASGEAVLALVSSHLAVMNEVNVSTALMTICRRVGKGEATWLRDDPRFAQLLRVAQAGFEVRASCCCCRCLLASELTSPHTLDRSKWELRRSATPCMRAHSWALCCPLTGWSATGTSAPQNWAILCRKR
jgi:hypothetical protein